MLKLNNFSSLDKANSIYTCIYQPLTMKVRRYKKCSSYIAHSELGLKENGAWYAKDWTPRGSIILWIALFGGTVHTTHFRGMRFVFPLIQPEKKNHSSRKKSFKRRESD